MAISMAWFMTMFHQDNCPVIQPCSSPDNTGPLRQIDLNALIIADGYYKATFTYARSGCGAEMGEFWHSRSATAGMFAYTRSGHGQICHFFRTKMVWSMRFRSGHGKLGVGPICCIADFAPALPPLRDRVCVNECTELCWSQFSSPPLPTSAPCMCESTLRPVGH